MAPHRIQRSMLFRSRALDLWPTMSAGAIATRLGTTRNVILSVVRTAREAGDKRAVPKPEGTFPRPAGWFREGCPRTWAVSQSGVAKRRLGL